MTRSLTRQEVRDVAAIAASGEAYCSPKTYFALREGYAALAFEPVPSIDRAPLGVRLIVRRDMPDGYIEGADGTRVNPEVLLNGIP